MLIYIRTSMDSTTTVSSNHFHMIYTTKAREISYCFFIHLLLLAVVVLSINQSVFHWGVTILSCHSTAPAGELKYLVRYSRCCFASRVSLFLPSGGASTSCHWTSSLQLPGTRLCSSSSWSTSFTGMTGTLLLKRLWSTTAASMMSRTVMKWKFIYQT